MEGLYFKSVHLYSAFLPNWHSELFYTASHWPIRKHTHTDAMQLTWLTEGNLEFCTLSKYKPQILRLVHDCSTSWSTATQDKYDLQFVHRKKNSFCVSDKMLLFSFLAHSWGNVSSVDR